MIESDVWLLFGLVQFHGMISACRDSLSLVGKCRQLLLYFARPTLCHPLRVRGMCAQRPCWVAEVAYVMPLGYLCAWWISCTDGSDNTPVAKSVCRCATPVAECVPLKFGMSCFAFPILSGASVPFMQPLQCDSRLSDAKHNSITLAATAARNDDAAIPLRSANI